MVWGDFNTEELTQNAQADCQNPSLWWNHLRRQTVQSFDHPCLQGYWKKGKRNQGEYFNVYLMSLFH